VLSVLQEVTVGHIGCGRLHVTENVFPDAPCPILAMSVNGVSTILYSPSGVF
jgi:hypothetical protein